MERHYRVDPFDPLIQYTIALVLFFREKIERKYIDPPSDGAYVDQLCFSLVLSTNQNLEIIKQLEFIKH